MGIPCDVPVPKNVIFTENKIYVIDMVNIIAICLNC